MSCVHRLSVVLLFSGLAFAVDSPVPFVKKVAAQSAGLPGWYSSPARRGIPSFGLSYWSVPEVSDEWVASAAGEWGDSRYRMSFFYYYSEMDSLFSEHYGELNAAYGHGPAVLGAGYGTLLGLIPGDARWVRHRLKLGVGLQGGSLYGGVWTMGFTDEKWINRGSVSWTPTGVFSLSVESDGKSVGLGHDFFFKYGNLSCFYVFPCFSVGVELVLNFKLLEWGGTRGFGNGNLGWNGLWVRKKLYFQ